MGVRFGAFLFSAQFDGMTEADALRGVLRYAHAAERNGFDDLWVTEHHSISYGVNPDALTLAGYLLGATSKVRVGTAVSLLPHHSPVFVAERAALLDQLSGGRFDLGIGRGGPVTDLLVAGRSLEHWSHGYWEAVELLLRAWTGSVDAHGELYEFPEVAVKPRPRAETVPLWTASVSESSIEKAASKGIPLLLFLHETDESCRRAVDLWARIAAEHGHATENPGHAAAMLGHVLEPGESPETIGANLLAMFERSSKEYRFLPGTDSSATQPHSPEELRALVELMLATHPVADERECVRRLKSRVDNGGVDRVLLLMEGAVEPDRVQRNIAAFGKHVLPALREQRAGG